MQVLLSSVALVNTTSSMIYKGLSIEMILVKLSLVEEGFYSWSSRVRMSVDFCINLQKE